MINRILNHLEEWLIAFLIGAATLVIFFAVAHRFLSGIPYIQDYTVQLNVSWAQELCIFMFVWMAKFGAAYGVRTGIHVGVDVIIRKLTGKAQRNLVLFGLLSGALFTGTVATLGANFVWHIGHTDQVSVKTTAMTDITVIVRLEMVRRTPPVRLASSQRHHSTSARRIADANVK